VPLKDEGIEIILPILADYFPRLIYINLTACRLTEKSIDDVVNWVKNPAFKFPRAVLKVEMQH